MSYESPFDRNLKQLKRDSHYITSTAGGPHVLLNGLCRRGDATIPSRYYATLEVRSDLLQYTWLPFPKMHGYFHFILVVLRSG